MACLAAAPISEKVRPSPSAGDEHRVVAETARAPGLGGDRAIDHTLGRQAGPIRVLDYGHGSESGGPLRWRHVPEFGEQPGHVLGVAGVGARVPGGPHARFPAERVHLQPGVVGQRGRAGELAHRNRFEHGVAQQVVGVLDHVAQSRGPGQQHGRARQHLGHLDHLVGVGAGTDQLDHRDRNRPAGIGLAAAAAMEAPIIEAAAARPARPAEPRLSLRSPWTRDRATRRAGSGRRACPRRSPAPRSGRPIRSSPR